jgi:beta-glucanase (GH16 family)
VLRTKLKSDTWNATGNRYDYPQTPSRIMLSLWPAGLSSNAPGTINWAGGVIDWNSQYMKNGYYYAMFSDVNVECYSPPSGARVSGSKSYIYTDTAGTNQSIEITDDVTILKSLFASGDDPNNDPNGSATKSGSKPSATPESIPGVSGVGARNGDSSSSSGSGSGGGDGSSSGSFSQGGASGSKSGAGAVQDRLRGGGSAFAVLVTLFLGCVWL